ncbi:MAG: hypothetical protein LUD07_01710 [Clostridiales bacterium]|nr:hypothetical protein [Clostridiales bacterium]
MASRRMFSLDVTDTDQFLEMPLTTQALYFHLGLHADDDGFVSAPKKVLRMIGCKEDDLRVLISKNYVIPFTSGIIVITNWKENNYLRPDRYKPTRFQEEFKLLREEEGVYHLDTNGIPSDNQVADKRETQVRLGKVSIGKSSKTISSEPDKSAPSGILLNLIDGADFNVPEDKIESWEQAYPGVNVRQELFRMAAWLDANPTRKKTRRGITRFIVGWLERTQNRGGGYQRYEGGERQNGENSAANTESASTLKLW